MRTSKWIENVRSCSPFLVMGGMNLEPQCDITLTGMTKIKRWACQVWASWQDYGGVRHSWSTHRRGNSEKRHGLLTLTMGTMSANNPSVRNKNSHPQGGNLQLMSQDLHCFVIYEYKSFFAK